MSHLPTSRFLAVFLALVLLSPLHDALTPEQVRSTPHKFMLNLIERHKSVTYRGSLARLRKAMNKALNGQPIKVSVIGGSISVGHGAIANEGGKPYDKWARKWTDAALPGLVTWSNGAVAATTTTYMSLCVQNHVANDTDVVIMEYGVNNVHFLLAAGEKFNTEHTRSYERLIRKVLQLPNKPAIVLLNSYNFFEAWPEPGTFWGGSTERDTPELSAFYDVPSLSLKACCYHLLKNDRREGFMTSKWVLRDFTINASLQEKKKYFYADRVHPWGETGTRVLADMLIHLLQETLLSLQLMPYSSGGEEEVYVNETIPAPMVPGNYETNRSRCFVTNFKDVVLETKGFVWTNEAANGAYGKWGYVGQVPGSFTRIKINTTIAVGAAEARQTSKVLVQLGHLASYRQMGVANVTCESGCACGPVSFDGHSKGHFSLLRVHSFEVSQSDECILRVSICNCTSSGHTKVKLLGVIVSEEASSGTGMLDRFLGEGEHGLRLVGRHRRSW